MNQHLEIRESFKLKPRENRFKNYDASKDENVWEGIVKTKVEQTDWEVQTPFVITVIQKANGGKSPRV